MTRSLARWLLAGLVLCCTACSTLPQAQRDRAAAVAIAARSAGDTCPDAGTCAEASPLRALGDVAGATPPAADGGSAIDVETEGADGAGKAAGARHRVLLLDAGGDALLARVNLLRSARARIDLQTYIFDEDDAGQLVLQELLAAARRGVRVRVLVDQLSVLESNRTLAALAGAHVNFEWRVYNPIFGSARVSYPEYLLAAACCWRRLNQRMHSKLLLVDDRIGITGGRNYQDDYYDWDAQYDFRDRDLLVAGPAAADMAANFEAFWQSPRSVPAERLHDVGQLLLDDGVPPLPPPRYAHPDRAAEMSQAASDAARVSALAARAMAVDGVSFHADPPQKHRREADGADRIAAGNALRGLIASAREEVLLQTPYLVLSEPAQELFRELQRREVPPRVLVSTNSLAATDAFVVYALSHKYKRRYLREFGFHIYEYKPFPQDAPIDLAATRAPREIVASGRAARRMAQRRAGDRRMPLGREHVATRYFGSGANAPVPLRHAGVRIGLHAKSLVVDERIGVVGTHNFDPRGDRYNTESAVVVDDPAFARALAASIRRDMAPANSWVIAPRDKPPVLSGLEYSLGKVSEQLPLFDLWPWRYATSYAFVPGPDCPLPLPRDDPDFRRCYRPVGDFPEVNLGPKWLATRIFTAFGAGLAPIL
jgi:phosphatidylserine/phosphatidylglycerophosphate/cardiolipin synthase-like enzyme